MTTIAITRNDEGKIVGVGEKAQKAYLKFRAMIEALEQGEIATVAFWFPRNRALMGWHIILLTALFEQQEQFNDFDIFRKWIATGAGHADFYPGPKGRMVAVPRSIDFDSIDDHDFSDLHERCVDFMRGEICTNFLWPHLAPEQQADFVSQIIADAEAERERIRAQRGKGKE